MKRLFTLFAGLLVLLWSHSSLQAQTTTDEHEDHASWLVGGVASFWVNSDAKTASLELHLGLGYFSNDTWVVGLVAGYGLKSYETTNQEALQYELSLSPFVRYYFLHRGPFNLYLNGSAGCSYERQGEHSHQGFEVGLRPGACLDLADDLYLYIRLGFLGYRKSFYDDEPGVFLNGFGPSFTPEHLMVGLELKL